MTMQTTTCSGERAFQRIVRELSAGQSASGSALRNVSSGETREGQAHDI